MYGITLDDYNNMFENQEGRCWICKRHHSELERTLHVDHCHATGKVRGLLCDRCNMTLGALEDNIVFMQNMILYLKENG
jgi:hypothetical protein